jgi:hypothetical protein
LPVMMMIDDHDHDAFTWSRSCKWSIFKRSKDFNIVACSPKVGISESERVSVARQRPGIHVSCTTEVTFSWQRPGKCLFSQQGKELCHENGGINCSIRCSLVGKPSSYERGCIHEQNRTEVGIEAKSSEAKFRVQNWRHRTEVRGESRRPEVQDADNSEGFGIQK